MAIKAEWTVIGVFLIFLAFKTVSSCPPRCKCEETEGKYVTNCSVGGMTKIPYDIDPRTNILLIIGPKENSNEIHGIPRQAFVGSPNLEEIHIINGNVNGIEDNAFEGLSKCHTLILRNNGLSRITESNLHGLISLSYLDLRNNGIAEFPSGFFSEFGKLRHLDLGYNGMRTIPALLFLNLTKLHTINFDGNPFGKLNRDVFGDVENSLRHFSCDNCSITELSRDNFLHMRYLQTLSLQDNLITSLENQWFSKWFPGVTHLNLSGNKIRRFGVETFNKMYMKELDLSHNRLSEANLEEEFNGLVVRKLFLGYNGFSHMNPTVLKPLSSGLMFLDLSGNSLNKNSLRLILSYLENLAILNLTDCGFKEFPHGVIPYFYRLKQLIIARNYLEDIPPRLVNELAEAGTTIDLSNNRFTSIDTELVEALKTANVSLKGNRWHCDCNIMPLYLWLKTLENCTNDDNIGETDVQCLTCATPSEYKNFLIQKLNQTAIEVCPSKGLILGREPIIAIIVIAVVLLIGIIVILCLIYKTRMINYYTKEDKEANKVEHENGGFVNDGLTTADELPPIIKDKPVDDVNKKKKKQKEKAAKDKTAKKLDSHNTANNNLDHAQQESIPSAESKHKDTAV